MQIINTVVTVFDVFLLFIFLVFSKDKSWKTNKSEVIGFGFMEIVCLANMILIWV